MMDDNARGVLGLWVLVGAAIVIVGLTMAMGIPGLILGIGGAVILGALLSRLIA